MRRHGFESFDPWAEDDAESEAKDPNVKTELGDDLLPEEKLKRSYNKQNLISWLKHHSRGRVVKAQRWSQYLSNQPAARKEDLKLKMRNDPAVAMVGFKVTPTNGLRVRVVLEDSKGGSFDPAAFAAGLEHVVKAMCGFSHLEMYSEASLRKNQNVKYNKLNKAPWVDFEFG